MEQEQEPTTLLKDHPIEQRGAYLGAIATMASADGNATAEELEFLKMLAEAADLPENLHQEIIQIAQNPSQISLQQCLDTLKQSSLRFSLITDIISFAKSDGQYSPEEQQRIQEISNYLGIDQKQFSILDQFVDKANTAKQQGEDPTSPAFLNKSGFGDMFKNVGISPQMVTGMLGILAPIVLSRMMRGGRRSNTGGMGGGLLGGLLGGIGGMQGGMSSGGGGLGSIISILGGLNGRRGYGSMGSGGLGGLLGGILGGGRRNSGW